MKKYDIKITVECEPNKIHYINNLIIKSLDNENIWFELRYKEKGKQIYWKVL